MPTPLSSQHRPRHARHHVARKQENCFLPGGGAFIDNVHLDCQFVAAFEFRSCSRAIWSRRSGYSSSRVQRRTAARPACRDICSCNDRPGLAGLPHGRSAKKIGTWPTSRGQVTGSRPVGLNFPVNTSAMAFPASTPRNQVATTAWRLLGDGADHQRPPRGNQRDDRLAELENRFGKRAAGRRADRGSPGSPLRRSWWRLRQGTKERDRRRGKSPARRRCPTYPRHRSSRPGANTISASGSAAARPSRIVTGSAAFPAAAHGPSMSARASASGPMSGDAAQALATAAAHRRW